MIIINYYIPLHLSIERMLAKFETKSSRVKGIAFHPTRPWILCSLHDGCIQLWDYRVGTLLETFSEHDGPVRSVDFHPSQPLFVSGGDDYKIRVWNYNNKRSLFTLMGHLDYIRTVQFHHENPWIVSCSDDQNIRIWNWQSRECIAVLTGHNHYVMCAQFHPKEDLVVSASLDQTIRVWDISGLKQKGKKIPGKTGGPSTMLGRLSTDLVGTVKYVLEGHERGVNWASFHPELPLIVSGSDDRMIKIWRTNETKAWEVDTLRGHTNNVSCVMFHPREDLILSDGEDHSIRVWDSTKRIGIQSFVRAHDRFWIIIAHKTQNLLAAGHDSGAVVFKLRRERPPFVVHKNYCFYVKDRYYRIRELEGSGRDIVLMPITRGPAANNAATRRLQFNMYSSSDLMLLMHNAEDGGSYELLCYSGRLDSEKITPDVASGAAKSVCFLGRNKFATLEGKDTLCIRNSENIVTKRVPLPFAGCEQIFPGGVSGRVLLYNDHQLVLFDTASFQMLGAASLPGVKRVAWSADNSMLAVMSATSVRILTKDLKQLGAVTEKRRVKDCVWDERGAVLYSTLSQIKYLLPSGESGVVRSLEEPVYLICLRGSVLHVFNRESALQKIEIDATEYLFKLSLENHRYHDAIRIIRSNKVDSQAIIGYLQRNGFEDIALYFVTEPRAKFNLALRCGKLEVAEECARELNEPAIWTLLADEALRQGDWQIVEQCYVQTKAFDKLSFFYILTGNQEKLRKMLRVAEVRGDASSFFSNAVYLGDVAARVKILRDVGQLSLAYITAVTYGLDDAAAELRAQLDEQSLPVPQVSPVAPESLLSPPSPVPNALESLPVLDMARTTFDRVMQEEQQQEQEGTAHATTGKLDALDADLDAEFQSIADEGAGAGWGDDLGFSDDAGGDGDDALDAAGSGWGDDLAFSDDDDAALPAGPELAEQAAPAPGVSVASAWAQSSPLAYDQAAAGDVDAACRLLNRQIGAAKLDRLAAVLRGAFLSVQAVTAGFAGMPALETPLLRSSAPPRPLAVFGAVHVAQLAKMGLKCFQNGRFEDTLAAFRSLLQILPCVVAANREEEAELRRALELAREYILAVRLELARKASPAGSAASLLRAALMTHCALQSGHLLLALNNAMVAAYKAENFIDAAGFAARILASPEAKSPRNAALEQKARKVLQRSEREGRNAVESGYDPRGSFAVEAKALEPLNKGEERVRCPYCGAVYRVDAAKTLCEVCELATVGLETVGLVCVDARS